MLLPIQLIKNLENTHTHMQCHTRGETYQRNKIEITEIKIYIEHD